MTSKYQFDSVRWLRSWSARKRFLLADGRDPFGLVADEIHRLRMAVDLHEQGAELMREENQALRARHNALKEAASRSLDDAYNSFGGREEAHERLIDVAKLVVKSWNTVELGALKDAIEDMAALVGEGF